MPNSGLPKSMTSIAIREPGGPDKLLPQQQPVPAPGEGEILMRVAAAGVNRPDVMERWRGRTGQPGRDALEQGRQTDGARGRRGLRRILPGFCKPRAAGAGKSFDDRGRRDSGDVLHRLAQRVRARKARRRRNLARARRLIGHRHHSYSARQGVRRSRHRNCRHVWRNATPTAGSAPISPSITTRKILSLCPSKPLRAPASS